MSAPTRSVFSAGRRLAGIVMGVAGLAGLAHGQFGPATSFIVGAQPDGVAVGDWDGDSDLDLAAAVDAPDRVVFLFNDGHGGFGGAVAVPTGGSGAHAVAAADFDGDGDVDVAVTLHNSNAVRVLRNGGSGAFTLGSLTPTGADPRALRVANFNGGAPDLVTANRDGNSVSVLLNTGTGNFIGTTLFTGSDPRDVNVGDLNGDSDVDLVVAVHDNRRLELFANNGAGVFSGAGTVSLGGDFRPDGVVATDLDHDGDLDLASAVSDDGVGAVARLLNTGVGSGAGSFASLSFFPTGGAEPQKIVAADFDIDGDVDVATANETSGNVTVLANSGSGSFGGPALFAVGNQPQFLIAADLDGDHAPDLAVANEGSNSVSVLLNLNVGPGFSNLGGGLPGVAGIPQLIGQGSLEAGTPVSLTLSSAAPNALSVIVTGLSRADAPFKGGTLVPVVSMLSFRTTNGAGGFTLAGAFPSGFAAGSDLFIQVVVADTVAVQDFSLSNAVQGSTP